MSKQQENKNTLGAQMEFIARITMPDGTVIEKKVSADGGIPSAEEMDLGSVDGFLKSFDKYERAAIKARNEICNEITDSYLKELAKKKEETEPLSRTYPLESEIGRLEVELHGKAVSTLKPAQHVSSLSLVELLILTSIGNSYRRTVNTANMFLHLEGDASLKMTTMKDRTVSIGTALLRERQRQVDEILREYGIDDSIEDIADMASFPLGTVSPKLAPNLAYEGMELAIKAYNSIRENSGEKITQKDKVCDIEASPYDCCYISVDDVGVKHQKEHREENAVKDKKYVENTVIHIQAGEISHCITAVGMDIAFRELLAFLLVNELLENKRLIFLTDGARNIKEYIEKIFSFREYTLILDWLHLEKKTKEFMSMAVKAKSKDEKRGIIRDTLRMLWVGNVDEAISYLTNLKAKNVKNEYRLKELTDYLTRKKPFVPCYAVRHMNGLRTSSNIVEKFNDILVARRQKHNGMSWSVDGSGALAAITSAKMNNELSTWLRDSRISIKLAA